MTEETVDDSMLKKMAWTMSYRWALDDYEDEEARKAANVDWPDWVGIAKAALEAIKPKHFGDLPEGVAIAGENAGAQSLTQAHEIFAAMINAILTGDA